MSNNYQTNQNQQYGSWNQNQSQQQNVFGQSSNFSMGGQSDFPGMGQQP